VCIFGKLDLGAYQEDEHNLSNISTQQQQKQMEQLDQEVRRISLNDQPPNFSPARPPRTRQLSSSTQQPVRYSFAESDDEEAKEEDPIAWALASRSGRLM